MNSTITLKKRISCSVYAICMESMSRALFCYRQQKGKVGKDQLKSIFELPPKTLQKLENKWIAQIKRENPDQELTFAQWVGLEAEQT